jgi:uncharacterized Zn finger protein
MHLPSTFNLECPSCGKQTVHDIKKGKLSTKGKITYDSVVECTECNHVHHVVITEDKHIEIPVIISTLEKSKKDSMTLPPDTRLSIGEEFMLDDVTLKVTGIELDGKRVTNALASEIKTLWCKSYDKVKLKLSISRGSRTVSRSLFAVPDEEFYIGDIIKSGRDQVVIHKIRTEWKTIKTGGISAREVVRLYGRFVR